MAFALAKCSVMDILPSVTGLGRQMLCPSLSSVTGRLAVLFSVSLMRPSHDYTASSHRFGLAIDNEWYRGFRHHSASIPASHGTLAVLATALRALPALSTRVSSIKRSLNNTWIAESGRDSILEAVWPRPPNH